AGGSLGVGRVGETTAGGVALRGYEFGYGLPVPPGTDPVSLRGRRYELSGRGELLPRGSLFTSMRLDGARQDYRHDELSESSGERLQAFNLRTHTANLLLQ